MTRYEDLTKRQIMQAWVALFMPRLDQTRVVFDHNQWWVVGWDDDDMQRFYCVVEASGPGTAYGLAFEEV